MVKRNCGFASHIIASTIILLIGWLFIVHAGTQNKRFHPDEALYTTFARNAFVHGDWQLASPLDKPPLSIYANALSQSLFGAIITDEGVYDLPILVGEFVARLPNMFAGLITLALFIALERRLFGKKPLIGAYLLILAPFFYAFSASAFTDMLMLMWVLGAWLCAERGQSRLSGLLLGLGFATKPQAIFFLPLLILRGLWRKPSGMWVGFGLAFGMVIMALLWWDGERGTTSVFALGQYNYPTDSLLASPQAWLDRAWRWATYLFWGMNPGLIGVCVVIIGGRLWVLLKGMKGNHANSMYTVPTAYILIYSLAHIVLGIPLYDRYALLLIPLMALGIAYIAHGQTSIRWLLLAGIIGSAVVLYADMPIGRDGYLPDREGHIITLADEINALPFGAIVYDHWRGWELGYYLGAWSDKRRVYYPDYATQAQDSLDNPETATRFLVAPQDKNYAVWLSAMQAVGYEIYLYCQLPDYLIFGLIPPNPPHQVVAFHLMGCYSE